MFNTVIGKDLGQSTDLFTDVRAMFVMFCGDTCVVDEGCHGAKQDGDAADCEGQFFNH